MRVIKSNDRAVENTDASRAPIFATFLDIERNSFCKPTPVRPRLSDGPPLSDTGMPTGYSKLNTDCADDNDTIDSDVISAAVKMVCFM